MKRKKGWIAIIAVIAVIVLLFAGYNIYRYPAMFRSLSDNSLNDSQESYDLTNKLITPFCTSGPAYDYRQQEIELYNQGQRIYGIAYITDTEVKQVPLVICAHGLGGSYQTNAAYAGDCMNRPYIICHILSELDGKITGEFMRTENARSVSEEYGRIRAEYQADAWLYGTITTKEFTGWQKPEPDFGAEVPDGDFVAEAQADL